MVQNKFVIITPVYNTAPYIEKCIMSALNQTYKNFDFTVVDDCSTDGTTQILLNLLAKTKGFKLHINKVRTESPIGNFKLGVDMTQGDGEDILVTLDGDDWFYDDNVLEYLNGVYKDPDIWLTYGQFVSATGKVKNVSKQLKNPRTYRKTGDFVTSHLRTIKRKLWQKINPADLRDKHGKYYVYYPDLAYMLPAVEMAGLKHSKFIDKVLLVYNDLSPFCSAEDYKKKDMSEVYKVAYEIRAKPQYKELDSL